MSFVIHGLGTAHPPDPVSPEDGLAIARERQVVKENRAARLRAVKGASKPSS